jgi:hypothetical protein
MEAQSQLNSPEYLMQSFRKVDTLIVAPPKPEILSGGFIEVYNNGQMNASARLFRLYIGEPGKFQIPVSIFTGVSGNNFNSSQQAEELAIAIINPGAGTFSLNFDGNSKLAGKAQQYSSLHVLYHSGFRYLSVFNRNAFRSANFYNFISGLGLAFVTGAWERNRTSNMGYFWLSLRGIYSHSPPSIFRNFFTEPVDQNILGYAGGIGIEISRSLNVKANFFHILSNRDMEAFNRPVLQVSFNYSAR